MDKLHFPVSDNPPQYRDDPDVDPPKMPWDGARLKSKPKRPLTFRERTADDVLWTETHCKVKKSPVKRR